MTPNSNCGTRSELNIVQGFRDGLTAQFDLLVIEKYSESHALFIVIYYSGGHHPGEFICK